VNPYGWAHQQDRADWQGEIERTGGIRCACRGTCGHHAGRCTTIIRPDTPWHLGHRTAVAHGGANGPKAPWCEPCNERDGVKVREAIKAAPRASIDWDPEG